MPKTKDAFALRGFDEKRILQRRWFKDLDLAVGKDEDVLRGFYNVFEKPIPGVTPSGYLKVIAPTEEGYLAGMAENLLTLNRLYARAGIYEKRIEQHMWRLSDMKKSFAEKFLTTEDFIYKEKFIRVTDLIKRYSNIYDSTIALHSEALRKLGLLQELFEKDFRQRFFGARLRQARKAAGLTQEALASRLGIKRSSYGLYEQGRNEPNVSVLALLSCELNHSADWFLGLSP